MEHDNRRRKIFDTTHFDINNFKSYFDEGEYESLTKEFETFSKGQSAEEKENYVKNKLLGQKIKTDAKKEISQVLRSLFEGSQQEISQDANPGKVFENTGKLPL